jgi:hypothetical protein
MAFLIFGCAGISYHLCRIVAVVADASLLSRGWETTLRKEFPLFWEILNELTSSLFELWGLLLDGGSAGQDLYDGEDLLLIVMDPDQP